MDKKELKLKIQDEILKGVYANNVTVMHSKYDFVLDFITMFPPEAIVNSRVITNPASIKKMAGIINANIKKYEEKYGVIDIDEEVHTMDKVN